MCQYCGNPDIVHSDPGEPSPDPLGNLPGKNPSFQEMVRFMWDLHQSPDIVNDADPRAVITVNATDIAGDVPRLTALQGALASWSAVVPFSFDVVTQGDQGDFYVIDDVLGQAFWASGAILNVGADWHERDIDGAAYGSYTYKTFIHELGHAFGLGHPGNYNRIIGQETNYVNSAQYTHDHQQYSVMSYFFQDQAGIGTSRWEVVTPMWADIEGVIQRFFASKDDQGNITAYQDIQLNVGDDVYGFGPDAKAGYRMSGIDDPARGLRRDIGFTIHDTGGRDTLNLSGSTDAVVLDLRPGHFSSANGHTENICIYPGHNADQADYFIEIGIGSRFDDLLIGNDGDNMLIGYAGADHFVGGGGIDTVDYSYMTIDNYRIAVDLGRNRATGDDAGGDTFDSIENLRGGARSDFFVGDAVGNGFWGNDGDDRLLGVAGDDHLHGGNGSDQLEGGTDNDSLFGDSGGDYLTGDAGGDLLDGGDGKDVARYVGSAVGVVADLATGRGIGGEAEGDSYVSIENLEGSTWNDTLVGDAGANVLIGGAGVDELDGGLGADTASYASSSTGVTVDLGLRTVTGGDAEGDRLKSIENLDGSALADRLTGDAGANILRGGDGADNLDGGGGVDTASYVGNWRGVEIDLAAGVARGGHADGDSFASIENLEGSAFEDKLTGDIRANLVIGGVGEDILDGGAGKDTLAGGIDADRFVIAVLGDSVVGTGADRIVDFSHAQSDKIDVSAIDASTEEAGNQAFTFIGSGLYTGVAGQLRFAQFGGNTTVAGDVNGDGTSDFHIRLTGTVGLIAADFVL
ncbi:M10 family metallopeptidase C-terminal domain-containing protein [Inquilinus limosus]|uniref:M10 family metallopeptidase C-terminal domain-containing protein n=1 Tax=Inquilinus limosus TaxID=171674 RepID=UPI003F18C5EF